MNVVIVGLGIIGGSMAKAVSEYTDCHVIGINRSDEALQKAMECGAIHEIGTLNSLNKADLIILGVYPEVAVEFIRKNADKIPKDCIVTDTSGIKSKICPALSQIAKEYGFTFIGCHPMAGKEKNGFDVSEATLFRNASCIILPCNAPQEKVDFLSDFMMKLLNSPMLSPALMYSVHAVQITRDFRLAVTEMFQELPILTAFYGQNFSLKIKNRYLLK